MTSIFNVVNYGAVANDNVDDKNAIGAAVNAAIAAGGGVVYFPAGIYLCNTLTYTGLKNVSFEGDGFNSIVKAIPASQRIMKLVNPVDVSFRNIAFDANGTLHYGGIAIYAGTRILIEKTRFFDGNVAARAAIPANGWTDIYSYVFGRGGPNRNICIRQNEIEDLQLEVDSVYDSVIWGNTIRRPVATAGIGIFSLQELPTVNREIAASNVTIQYNKIYDIGTARTAIALHLDPPVHTDGSPLTNIEFRDVRIVDNDITLTAPNLRTGYLIKCGQVDNSKATSGIVFDGITIANNNLTVVPGVEPTGSELIQLMTSRPSTPDFYFTKSVVRDNTFHYNGTKGMVGIYGGFNVRFPA